jgi:hypothetical protein
MESSPPVDNSQWRAYAGSVERRPATAAEARALANPLRIRILRLCLDRALTNKELAERLGRDPGTILHHVRTLVATGFLAPEADRRGARGATERPYRATGKSWTLDIGESTTGMLAVVDAFREELAEIPAGEVRTLSRLGVRLSEVRLAEFLDRVKAIVDDMYAADDAAGEPYGFFVALHRRQEADTAVRRPGAAAEGCGPRGAG